MNNCVVMEHKFSANETDFQYFMDNVKKHEYVVDNDEARPIIIKALSFLYELDEIGKREIEVEKSFFNLFSILVTTLIVNLKHISLYVLLTDSHTIDCNS